MKKFIFTVILVVTSSDKDIEICDWGSILQNGVTVVFTDGDKVTLIERGITKSNRNEGKAGVAADAVRPSLTMSKLIRSIVGWIPLVERGQKSTMQAQQAAQLAMQAQQTAQITVQAQVQQTGQTAQSMGQVQANAGQAPLSTAQVQPSGQAQLAVQVRASEQAQLTVQVHKTVQTQLTEPVQLISAPTEQPAVQVQQLSNEGAFSTQLEVTPPQDENQNNVMVKNRAASSGGEIIRVGLSYSASSNPVTMRKVDSNYGIAVECKYKVEGLFSHVQKKSQNTQNAVNKHDNAKTSSVKTINVVERRNFLKTIEDSSDCVELTRHFEKKYNIPDGLLLAIACVESTKRPWAVNNYRESRYFQSLDDAMEYICQLEKQSQLSISVGYMQINWMVHKSEFKSLRDALKPYHNVEFAAKLLNSLYQRFGSWDKAVMWYNPKGTRPNYEYLQKICKHCPLSST
ncbi:MAG: transglycosylase SLT domain-containing protein [Holosporales bacterium]|jgi:hypothetical protein|nr:transglycosylase SLT domain-containing protein [Holosporales bacterium]